MSGLKKAKTNSKLVREITLAARGGADPAMNARHYACVEKAKRESVPKDAIQRAINKGAGIGEDKLTLEHVIYEGRAPHNVPVIVEVYTDNVQRTAPEIRVLFRKGQLASSGANKFVFDLHEVGHHAIGFKTYKKRCEEEYHVWMWAFERMRFYGVEPDERVWRRFHLSMQYAVGKAVRRGCREIPEPLVQFLPVAA